MNLEAAFHEKMLEIYERAKAECGYKASRFHKMVLQDGGYAAAKKLLASSQYSEGLTRLWELQRLDISMEALVLQEPWNTLFTPSELALARKHLQALGYSSP